MALDQLDSFMNSISALESGHDYDAVGPYTGSTYGRARGRYQMMEKLYPNWARAAGVDPNDWSAAAQDKVAKNVMAGYYRQFGSWDLVAVAWFAGPGRAKQAQRKGIKSVGGIKDMLGTSVSSYVSKVVTGMGDDTPSPRTAPSNPRQADLAQGVGSVSQRATAPENPRQADLAQGVGSASQRQPAMPRGDGQALIAPIEAAPGTTLTPEQEQRRGDQIAQDTLGSIFDTISKATRGDGFGKVLDAKSMFKMPFQQSSSVEGMPTADVQTTQAPQPSSPENPRQADGPAPEGLEGAFGQAVAGLLAEAGGRVTIVSGRRSTAEQQRLYDLYKAGKGNLAAKPGTSNHEHGAAVDFGGDLELVRKLAPKYGLKAPVKGEPWHWELA